MQLKKSPAFQFYPADFLTEASTLHFSYRQRGVHIYLLCVDWLNDGIPKDAIQKIIKEEITEEITEVINLFENHPEKMGYLTSPRLQAERESQEKYRNTQSERGKVSAQKRQEQTAIKKPTRDKLSRPAKKSTELSKIKTPDYQNPDTQGNPREQLRGTRNIWLSAPEFERLKIRFNELNFTREQKEIAIAKVDTWFSENPKKLATSSSHITRILDWGIKTALELSTAESRAEKARAPQQQFLSAEEKRQRTNKETYEQLLRIETTAGDTGGYDEITNDSFLIALTSDRD